MDERKQYQDQCHRVNLQKVNNRKNFCYVWSTKINRIKEFISIGLFNVLCIWLKSNIFARELGYIESFGANDTVRKNRLGYCSFINFP